MMRLNLVEEAGGELSRKFKFLPHNYRDHAECMELLECTQLETVSTQHLARQGTTSDDFIDNVIAQCKPWTDEKSAIF
jgi:hypothetical protein